MISLSRTLGIVIGVSVASDVFDARSASSLTGFHAAFLVAAAVSTLALLLALLARGRG